MGDALRAGEARHGAMLRALPDLLFVFNRDSVYLDYYAPDATRPLRYEARIAVAETIKFCRLSAT